MDKIIGGFTPILIYAVIFALNTLLPGRWVSGYITKPDSADKMRYHLNGFTVFFIFFLVWFLFGYFDIVPFDYLYNYRWYGLAGAFITGTVFTLAVVLRYSPVRRSFPADLFLGRIENLQFFGGRVDVKMWLYLTGATLLGLNALSFMAHNYMENRLQQEFYCPLY
jgi:hypothetical protein